MSRGPVWGGGHPPGPHRRGAGPEDGRPVVVVCADESEGERMARDLTALSGKPVPMLTPRSFTFHNAATVSRQWEQRRLAMLHGLSTGS